MMDSGGNFHNHELPAETLRDEQLRAPVVTWSSFAPYRISTIGREIMKELTTYLTFDGNCREAMKFYAKCLGAELELMSFSDAPMEVPKESKDRIMHAKLTKGSAVLMASDTMPGMPFQQGNNFSIAVSCESAQETERLFTAFGENGKVTMVLHETFWAARFGMLTDQFGINWMFNLDKPAQ
jgi:PhnB protein